jgi:hypothetical protein
MTYLNWVVGGEVDAAVWIALFLVIVVAINMLPVKVSLLNILCRDADHYRAVLWRI